MKIGSLELLQTSAAMTLFNMSDPAWRIGSAGQETAAPLIADMRDESYDLVIMNPPFTRATNHEGAHADITNPAFAAFGATSEDQTEMGRRVNRLGRDSCYHGNAGIASAFSALAHRKLRRGGVLALVLPLSAAAGLSWQRFRRLLSNGYTDISVLSIAASENDDLSFSADTGLAECLVIARRLRLGETSERFIRFTSLLGRPQGLAHAGATAKNIHSSDTVRSIDDGPYGGTPLTIGSQAYGEIISAPCSSDGDIWGAVRISDYALAQTARALSLSGLWLPGNESAIELKVAALGDVGKLGLVHRDITGPRPRGPFSKASPSPTATYPALWNHDARKETRLICVPDSQLLVRQGMEAKAADVWTTAGRAHLNLDFRLNSQPLSAAFTERDAIGGVAWPNVNFSDSRFDYALSVWGNCTLGLVLFWWHSNRQQSGRGRITIRSAESLPVLDFHELSDDQLDTAEVIFEEFRDKELKPAYLADADPNRALLGFDESVYEAVRRLAAKWCAEPSVHGGKQRPEGAKLIV